MKSKMKVLVVEDDDLLREYFCNILMEEGYQVTNAPNGSVALEILDITGVDVVLTDYHMPIMNGGKLTQEIDKLEKKIPVILMSANCDSIPKELMEELMSLYAFLDKPFESDFLFNYLRNIEFEKESRSGFFK